MVKKIAVKKVAKKKIAKIKPAIVPCATVPHEYYLQLKHMHEHPNSAFEEPAKRSRKTEAVEVKFEFSPERAEEIRYLCWLDGMRAVAKVIRAAIKKWEEQNGIKLVWRQKPVFGGYRTYVKRIPNTK